MKSLLLLSGGLDSTSLAFNLRPDVALTINYGQIPAEAEIRASRNVCRELGINHASIEIDCRSIGSGLLAGTDSTAVSPCPEWWPFRNQLLISFAAGWGLARGISEIFVGSISSDSRHADGTSEFYEAIDGLLSIQEGSMRVLSPALHMTGPSLLESSGVTDRILGWTHSCHRSNLACGACPGCSKRREVLAEAGRFQ